MVSQLRCGASRSAASSTLVADRLGEADDRIVEKVHLETGLLAGLVLVAVAALRQVLAPVFRKPDGASFRKFAEQKVLLVVEAEAGEAGNSPASRRAVPSHGSWLARGRRRRGCRCRTCRSRPRSRRPSCCGPSAARAVRLGILDQRSGIDGAFKSHGLHRDSSTIKHYGRSPARPQYCSGIGQGLGLLVILRKLRTTCPYQCNRSMPRLQKM